MTQPMTPREKVDLKPCPFCGSEIISTSSQAMTKGPAYFWHKCETCGAETEGDYGEADAAFMWNRRTALASGSGDHAELEVVAWRVDLPHMVQVTQDMGLVAFFKEQGRTITPLVTAEAAAARIAALNAEVERWISAYKIAHDQATQNGQRATQVEARADRLAKALGEVRDWLALLSIADAADVMQGGPAMFDFVTEALREPKSGGGE